MKNTKARSAYGRKRFIRALATACCTLGLFAFAHQAQAAPVEAPVEPAREAPVASSLPEAPMPVEASLVAAAAPKSQNVAGPHAFIVLPDQTAPRLSGGDKFVLGVKSATNPLNIVGWAIAAGYSQAVNGLPNYGQGAIPYAQRFGAAAARGASETFISNSILAPLLHEDPRYYKRGSGHSFVSRVGYAITRPLIVKTDGGRNTVNLQGIGGDLFGSALTALYYPDSNKNVHDVLSTWGGSVGGDAFVYLSAEFLGDLARGLHLAR